METFKLKNQIEMEQAIEYLDPFQNPTDGMEIERDTIKQLQWLSTCVVQVNPRVAALIDYWKDVGNKVLEEIKKEK